MKKLIAIAMAIVLLLAMAAPVAADDEIDVYPGDSIQAAIDAADEGDTIVVHAGEYHQSVVISTNDITLEGEEGAILDGDSPADTGTTLGVDAIRLSAGVSGVTIEGFEIRDYTAGARSSGIVAWNDGTSDITVEDNEIHDNAWNGILVGNEGTGLHTGWVIEDNEVYDNGYVGIEITAGEDCKIEDNEVDGEEAGILVHARKNAIHSSGIKVEGNTVSGATYGIWVFAWLTATLSEIEVSDNEVHDNFVGIYLWSYQSGLVEDSLVAENDVYDNYYGILVDNTHDSEVSENEVSDSGSIGIGLIWLSSGNLIEENEVEDSGSFDLYWDGTGSGNVWKENEYGTKTDNIVQEED